MADTNEFPRLLYKKSEGGSAQPVWNLGNFEVKEAADRDAVDAALADGWTLRPDDEPAVPKADPAQKPARSKAAADPAPPVADPQPDPAPAAESLSEGHDQ